LCCFSLREGSYISQDPILRRNKKLNFILKTDDSLLESWYQIMLSLSLSLSRERELEVVSWRGCYVFPSHNYLHSVRARSPIAGCSLALVRHTLRHLITLSVLSRTHTQQHTSISIDVTKEATYLLAFGFDWRCCFSKQEFLETALISEYILLFWKRPECGEISSDPECPLNLQRTFLLTCSNTSGLSTSNLTVSWNPAAIAGDQSSRLFDLRRIMLPVRFDSFLRFLLGFSFDLSTDLLLPYSIHL
jgi:hypothetical protein